MTALQWFVALAWLVGVGWILVALERGSFFAPRERPDWHVRRTGDDAAGGWNDYDDDDDGTWGV